MRRRLNFALFLIAALALFAACSGETNEPETSPETTMTVTPTAPPDYSGTDFTGDWRVSEIIASDGVPLTSAEMLEKGADFTLELLEGGAYFVYDAEGNVLGQGQYSVTANILSCITDDGITEYEIIDSDTLECRAGDNSVTVMSRVIEEYIEPAEPEEDTEGGEPDDDTDSIEPEEDSDNPGDDASPENKDASPENTGTP